MRLVGGLDGGRVSAGRSPTSYNDWVNALLQALTAHPALPAASSHLPAGLTVEDAVRIAEALRATYTESTRTIYRHAWRHWERWCATRQVPAMPAAPAMICAYLTERATEGLSVGSLDLTCGAIAYQHRQHGLADPTLTAGVRQVRRGLRRLVGTAPRRQARPLALADIQQIISYIDRTTPPGVRDAAIILLGYASAVRRSELAALTLADLEPRPGGVLLTVRRSKTDPEGHGQQVPVATGRHASTDPVAALAAWIELRGRAPGRIFTSMRGGTVTHKPISGDAISIMLRKRAYAAGLDATRITGHSLRAGHATTAALAGVSLDRIANQTRHKRLSTLVDRYIRPAQALEVTSSRDLGL